MLAITENTIHSDYRVENENQWRSERWIAERSDVGYSVVVEGIGHVWVSERGLRAAFSRSSILIFRERRRRVATAAAAASVSWSASKGRWTQAMRAPTELANI